MGKVGGVVGWENGQRAAGSSEEAMRVARFDESVWMSARILGVTTGWELG